MPRRLPSRLSHQPDATTQLEELSVASLVCLLAIVREAGAPSSLLYARIDWRKYQGESSAVGAPTPAVAHATYTRAALRRRHARQVAFRSGRTGLLRSLAAA